MKTIVKYKKHNENKREGWMIHIVNQEVLQIIKGEVKAAMKRIKNGNTVGPDDIPVEAW